MAHINRNVTTEVLCLALESADVFVLLNEIKIHRLNNITEFHVISELLGYFFVDRIEFLILNGLRMVNKCNAIKTLETNADREISQNCHQHLLLNIK